MEGDSRFRLTKPSKAIEEVVIRQIITNKSIFVGNIPFNTPYALLEGDSEDYRHKRIKHIIDRIPHDTSTCGIVLYMANGKMNSLSSWKLSKSERKWCDLHGMHFCFYEPLCLYDVNEHDFNFGFYSEFPDNSHNKRDIRSWELDSVKQWAEMNGLSNVHCHTGDYGCETELPYYGDTLKLWCNDIFLGEHAVYHTHEFALKRNFKRKFICTTWRYTTARRHVCAWLSRKPQDNMMSWYFDCSRVVCDDSMCILNSPALDSNIKNFAKLDVGAPWYLDLPADQPTVLDECVGHAYPKHIGDPLYDGGHNPVHENPIHYVLRNYYDQCFCDIVTESRFAQPTGNISEKVFQAIQFATPFVLVAPPHSLQYMRELGFQTFSEWWDESYDSIENNGERLAAILSVCESIRNRSAADLDVIYREMRDVLWHNWENLIRNVCVTGRVLTRFTYAEKTVQATSFAPDHDHSDMDAKTDSRTGIVQDV